MSLNVLEIRNYLLPPDQAQHFIDYFEYQMMPLLEAENMRVLGQCRVIGQPDHFVWLRAYPDMDSRLTSLRNFYDGPVWKKYRTLVNSMLRDSDDVLLLKPLLPLDALTRGITSATIAQQMDDATISPRTGMIAVDVYHACKGERDTLVDVLWAHVLPAYEQNGVQVRGLCVGEMAENGFPRHPAVQDENMVVVITAYESETKGQKQRGSLAPHIDEQVATLLDKPTQTLLLKPTLRSPLRYL